MTAEGQIVLFQFPQTDQAAGKLRPALLLRRLPGRFDDWLICMISTRLRHALAGLDEIMLDTAPDFESTGLKVPSLIRITRLAVVCSDTLEGAIGRLSDARLDQIRNRLGSWITGTGPATPPTSV